MPGLAEEVAAEALPWGAGEPAGWAGGLELALGGARWTRLQCPDHRLIWASLALVCVQGGSSGGGSGLLLVGHKGTDWERETGGGGGGWEGAGREDQG